MKTIPCRNTKSITDYLQRDFIMIAPTDTIYGLQARANPANLRKMNLLKRRDLDQPLITLISNVSQITPPIKSSNLPKLKNKQILLFVKLSDNGSITAIFKDLEGDPSYRLITKSYYLNSVISIIGPLYSTSANIHGQPLISSPREAKELFNYPNVVYLENIPKESRGVIISPSNSKPSTMLTISRKTLEIIRPGIVSRERIAEIIKEFNQEQGSNIQLI